MITYLIIGITVILSFICFSNRELFMKLAFIPYRTIRNHEYYRIVTHGFIHADMTHLLVNMFTFWSFGLYIERTFRYMGFGSGAYLALYFGGMIVASLYDLIKRRNDPYYVSIGKDLVFRRTACPRNRIRLAISGLLPVYGETNRR